MRTVWMLSIIIGIGAFLISYYLEATVFLSITANVFLALSICAVLEITKATTIVVHQALKTKNFLVPPTVEIISVAFKLGLIILSLICSIAIISKSMDRPNLKSVRQKELTLSENVYKEKSSSLKNEHDKSLAIVTHQVKDKYKTRLKELDAFYEPRIKKEENLRDYEFKRIINGVRKGPNWKEHNRLATKLTKDYQSEKEKLQNEQDNELKYYLNNIESNYRTKLNKLVNDREEEIKRISTKSYVNDERVKNQLIASLLLTLKDGLSLNLTYLRFTLLFSILISILLEGVIYICFNYAVIYCENVINKKEHRAYQFFEHTQSNSNKDFSEAASEMNEQQNSNSTENQFGDIFNWAKENFQNRKSNFTEETTNFDPCGDR